MFTIYRRHTEACPHRKKGRSHRKCACPIWIDNGLSGVGRIRYSLGTTVWTRANDQLRDIELGIHQQKIGLVTVADAAERYIEDLRGRRLEAPTLRKNRSILIGSSISRMSAFRKAPALVEWARENTVRTMQDWTLERVEAYRSSWTDAPLTAQKRLDALRAFFGWAKEHELCRDNYAAKLRRPTPRATPTLPYTREEFQQLLDACHQASRNEPNEGAVNRARLRSLLLVMRFTGLRISDALQLTEERIAGGAVSLHQHKTGEWVRIPLPTWLIQVLAETPKSGPVEWFRRPRQSIKNAHEHWRRKLAKVAAVAKVENPGFHRLRDTFAVELLLAGLPIQEVSILLGHTSIKMTEKHYAPWVRPRQIKMDSMVLAAWEVDPTAQRERLFGGEDGVRA